MGLQRPHGILVFFPFPAFGPGEVGVRGTLFGSASFLFFVLAFSFAFLFPFIRFFALEASFGVSPFLFLNVPELWYDWLPQERAPRCVRFPG